jgi:hypothetical protein
LPAPPTTSRNAPRATGSRIAINVAVAVVLVVMGLRSSGAPATISFVLAGIMALSALALAVIAYNAKRRDANSRV